MPASPWALGRARGDGRRRRGLAGRRARHPGIGGRALADIPQQRAELAFDLRIEDFALPSLEGLIREAGYPMPSLPPQHLTGFLRGFIDVVLAVERRYYVVDYKSNRLGLHREAYDEAGLRAAMESHHYAFQYLIYALPPCDGYCAGALAREVKRPLAAFAISFCGAWTPIPSWAFLLTP